MAHDNSHEKSTLSLSIDLHYFMDTADRHEMDASIHNKCEANMILALNHLGDLFDEDIQIDVSALEQGGVVDKFKLIFKSQTSRDLFLLLAGALISHFIGVSPSLDSSQIHLNRAEIIQRIKNGNFSNEEILYIIKGDPNILANKNGYYTELEKEPHVRSVTCSSYLDDDPKVKISQAEICKVDFSKQIVKGFKNTTQEEFFATSVLVVSPVLLQGSQAKWTGIFNEKEIRFKVVDKEFMKQVYAKEVGFTMGTVLNCDLKVVYKTTFDAMGMQKKRTYEIEISNITSWDDGKQIIHETKRYKRKKKENIMPSLFNDADFE